MTIHDFHSLSGISQTARLLRRLEAAKQAFTTRHVDLGCVARMVRSGRRPQPGDVILARVTELGQHRRIENIHGRRGDLYKGDEIIVAYGNRYAPDQFEAYVPESLDPCHLVAGGGVAALVASRHSGMKPATRIEVIGALLRDDGRAVNLADFALPPTPAAARPARVIAVIGSSMNAGKTTTVSGLIHGLTRAGFRVGAAKLTGTGSGGDLWSMQDAGAAMVLDFTDAGHASTFGVMPDDLGQITQCLLARLGAARMDIAVVEIADGLLQEETAALALAGHAAGWFDGFVFAAADAMGAAFGSDWLAKRGIAPLAISGLLTTSPLAMREAEMATGIELVSLAGLRDPIEAARIAFSVPGQRVAA